VELYTARLAQALPARGWRATVLTGRLRPGVAQNSVIEEEVDGIRVLGLVQNWPYRDLPEAVTDPALDRVLAGVLGDLRPDLVAVQSLHGLSAGFLKTVADARIPLVLHLHDGWLVCPSGGQRRHPDGSLCLPVDRSRCGACFDRFRHREGPLERWGRRAAAKLPGSVPPDALHRAFGALPAAARVTLKRVNERGARAIEALRPTAPQGLDGRITDRRATLDAALAHVDLAISPSAFLPSSLEADGLPLPPWQVVPSGVPGARQPLRGHDRLRVLFLGTFVPHKGPQVLAQALAQLPEEVALRIEARAHGPSPFPAWQEEVAQAAAGRLAVGGPVPPGDVAGLIADHDVVVVPSTWAENAPLVALEARAVGRPVISSDLGGLTELVEHGRDGLRFPAGDAAALATILARLTDREALVALAASVEAPPTIPGWVASIIATWTPLLRPAS